MISGTLRLNINLSDVTDREQQYQDADEICFPLVKGRNKAIDDFLMDQVIFLGHPQATHPDFDSMENTLMINPYSKKAVLMSMIPSREITTGLDEVDQERAVEGALGQLLDVFMGFGISDPEDKAYLNDKFMDCLEDSLHCDEGIFDEEIIFLDLIFLDLILTDADKAYFF